MTAWTKYRVALDGYGTSVTDDGYRASRYREPSLAISTRRFVAV
ncbi:hypothetical protein L810_8396 [Burkholderia sp. AU4i]|nr:hypothetical protein L810_8396 [Burkholderia sp. AU4i]